MAKKSTGDKEKKTRSKRVSAEEKKYKLNKYYNDDSDMHSDSIELSFSKMRYGLITHGDLVGVRLPDGRIDIKGSWIGLLILMVQTYYSNVTPVLNQKGFIVRLVEKEVISKGFDITSTYGVIDDETKYTAYKIPNTPYYIETNNSTKAIFQAIAALAKLLNMEYDTFVLEIKRKTEGLRNCEMEVVDIEVGISTLEDELKTSIGMKSISLFGSTIKVKNTFDIIINLVELLFKVKGMDAIEYIQSNSSIGIRPYKENCGFMFHKIENLKSDDDNVKIMLYTDNKLDKQLEFIRCICENLDISDEDMRVTLRKMKVKEI